MHDSFLLLIQFVNDTYFIFIQMAKGCYSNASVAENCTKGNRFIHSE